MPCENMECCPLLYRIEALEDDGNHNKSAHEKIYDRLNAIERDNSATSVQYDQIMKSLSKINEDLDELKKAPVKKFDALQMALISAVISAIVGLAIRFLGG